MRAHDRRLATVVTISGDIDATNIDRVSEYITRFVLVGNAIILDLSDVYFIAAQGISVLIAIDDVYCAAAVHWALVPSHAVSRLLRISDHDNILPTASSVPEAMRHLAKHARVRRRQLPLVTRRPSLRPGQSLFDRRTCPSHHNVESPRACRCGGAVVAGVTRDR
jgi:anti-anti-sigma factor